MWTSAKESLYLLVLQSQLNFFLLGGGLFCEIWIKLRFYHHQWVSWVQQYRSVKLHLRSGACTWNWFVTQWNRSFHAQLLLPLFFFFSSESQRQSHRDRGNFVVVGARDERYIWTTECISSLLLPLVAEQTKYKVEQARKLRAINLRSAGNSHESVLYLSMTTEHSPPSPRNSLQPLRVTHHQRVESLSALFHSWKIINTSSSVFFLCGFPWSGGIYRKSGDLCSLGIVILIWGSRLQFNTHPNEGERVQIFRLCIVHGDGGGGFGDSWRAQRGSTVVAASANPKGRAPSTKLWKDFLVNHFSHWPSWHFSRCTFHNGTLRLQLHWTHWGNWNTIPALSVTRPTCRW